MRSLRDPRLLLLAVTACFLVACLIGRRSDDLACSSSDECAPDRGCFEGFCVKPTCPEGCTCQTLLPDRSGYADCTIDCSGNRCRNSMITCPAGMACKVVCGNNDDCRRVDCSQAASCDIACSGVNTCQQGVTCGSGSCEVTCSGNGSCDGGVTCGSSCSCDVTCGMNACATPATCPAGIGCDTGLGCTPLPFGICNTCS